MIINQLSIIRFKINSVSKVIIISIIFALIINKFLFKYLFDDFFQNKKYYDFGVTLFQGKNPDIEMYFYISFIILSFIFVLFGWLIYRYKIINNFSFKKIDFPLFSMIILLLLTPLYAKTAIPLSYLLILLLTIIVATQLTSSKIELLFKVVLFTYFFIVVYYHIPKFLVLMEIFTQSGKPRVALGLFFLTFLMIFIVSIYATNKSLILRLVTFAIFSLMFYIGISEYRISWGIDVFHEGEGILNAHYLYNNMYGYYENFFPIHGIFRNTIPAYISGLFSDNNLYFVRVLTSFYASFYILLVVFLIYRFSNLTTAIAFFLLNYVYTLFNPLDLSPFFLVALILLTFAKKNSKFLYYFVGLSVGLDSLYSYEFMIFYFIAFLFVSLFHFYRHNIAKSPIRDIIFGFGFVWILMFVTLNIQIFSFFEYVVQLLKLSPNLLDRPLDLPKFESYYYLVVYVILPLFVFFYILKPTEYILLNKQNKYSFLLSIISLVSLMYFTRAFNRSDDGHIIQGLYIFIPIVLAFLFINSKYNRKVFLIFVVIVLSAFTYSSKVNHKNTTEFLKQSSFYDQRLELEAVPKGGHFGTAYVPLLSVDTLASHEELSVMQTIQQNGYKVFDYTNQPYLIYGIFGFELTNPDMYTIFSNTFIQQKNIVDNLIKSDKTIILFSASHWSETLDNTYQEYRLPIVSKFIVKNYKFKYKIGKFVLLSKEDLLFLDKYKKFDNQDFVTSYDLGKSPSRMIHYKNERISNKQEVLSSPNNKIEVKLSDSFDGLVINTQETQDNAEIRLIFKNKDVPIFDIKFKPSSKLKDNFVRFSHLALFNRGEVDNILVESTDCKIKDFKLITIEVKNED